jgi:hypothetical protein
LAAAALASVADAATFGKITVADNTKNGYFDVYLVGKDWVKNKVEINANGNGFSLNGGGRVYFATEPMDTFDDNSDKFWSIPLLDNRFSYKLDVSDVGCHCNAAAYFVRMPAVKKGNPIKGQGGDFYCDANFGNS